MADTPDKTCRGESNQAGLAQPGRLDCIEQSFHGSEPSAAAGKSRASRRRNFAGKGRAAWARPVMLYVSIGTYSGTGAPGGRSRCWSAAARCEEDEEEEEDETDERSVTDRQQHGSGRKRRRSSSQHHFWQTGADGGRWQMAGAKAGQTEGSWPSEWLVNG